MGVEGIKFSGKMRYGGVRFNVSVTREWVGVPISRVKKGYVTREWFHSEINLLLLTNLVNLSRSKCSKFTKSYYFADNMHNFYMY